MYAHEKPGNNQGRKDKVYQRLMKNFEASAQNHNKETDNVNNYLDADLEDVQMCQTMQVEQEARSCSRTPQLGKNAGGETEIPRTLQHALATLGSKDS